MTSRRLIPVDPDGDSIGETYLLLSKSQEVLDVLWLKQVHLLKGGQGLSEMTTSSLSWSKEHRSGKEDSTTGREDVRGDSWCL